MDSSARVTPEGLGPTQGRHEAVCSGLQPEPNWQRTQPEPDSAGLEGRVGGRRVRWTLILEEQLYVRGSFAHENPGVPDPRRRKGLWLEHSG